MKLKLYSDNDWEALLGLLSKFREEVYGSDTEINLDDFEDYHYAIYLVLSDENDIVGFSSFVINSYYGLRESTVGNDYMYILPEYRRSKAMHLISIQSGRICSDLGLPLEHYIASESSDRLSKRLAGKKIYCTYIYELSEVKRELERLEKKVRIKK